MEPVAAIPLSPRRGPGREDAAGEAAAAGTLAGFLAALSLAGQAEGAAPAAETAAESLVGAAAAAPVAATAPKTAEEARPQNAAVALPGIPDLKAAPAPAVTPAATPAGTPAEPAPSGAPGTPAPAVAVALPVPGEAEGPAAGPGGATSLPPAGGWPDKPQVTLAAQAAAPAPSPADTPGIVAPAAAEPGDARASTASPHAAQGAGHQAGATSAMAVSVTQLPAAHPAAVAGNMVAVAEGQPAPPHQAAAAVTAEMASAGDRASKNTGPDLAGIQERGTPDDNPGPRDLRFRREAASRAEGGAPPPTGARAGAEGQPLPTPGILPTAAAPAGVISTDSQGKALEDALAPLTASHSHSAGGHSAPDRAAATLPHEPRLPPGLTHRLAEAAARFPERPVEVTLSPEELGRVRMTLTTQDGALTLAVQADRPETLDLLRRNIDALAQDFRDLGFQNLAFSFGGGGLPDQPRTASQGAAGGDERMETAPLAAPPPRALAAGGGGLDLRL